MKDPLAPKISIIVATYNRPDALVLVLRAIADQRAGNFEVVVADDGSGPETKAAIDGLTGSLPYPLLHVWQPDEGFRLAAVRNRAAAQASGDYFAFIDGDCLPLPDFVSRQRQMAEPGWFVTGNRILLSRRLSERAIASDLPLWRWGRLDWIRARLQGDIRLLEPLLRYRNRSRPKPDWTGTEGCNIAVWRRDFLAVNGFDETYRSWGYEDSDFAHRLIASGCHRRATRWNVPLLHLWHGSQSDAQISQNRARFDETLASGRIRAIEGVDCHLT